ncbi:MAG: SPFH domain-containing protein [Thermoplasmatales archaeon]|nr:SPFH domain-containing protein [Thermoplasmatales archaeon]
MEVWSIVLAIFIIIVIMAILLTIIKKVEPYQAAVYTFLGKYKRTLTSGVNFVAPLAARLIWVDLRTQTLDVPRQDVITKDNSPTAVDAVIYIRVVDPVKACFEVQNYNTATIFLAQTTLRSVIGEMNLDEILFNRAVINAKLRDILDKATDPWGVKVEAVEIKEVDPVARVKAAMEEQTSAERERRAAILRADGEKRSAILTAEGNKRARILQAEGVRQSKILESQGERFARILEAQGEAQKLRILSLGAAPLDQKALTVLSLDTLKSVGNGQSTKIIFPFELSKLLEGVSDYIGVSRKIPETTPMKYEELEKRVGKAEDILGEIPKVSEMEKLEKKELEKEDIETKKIIEHARKGGIKEEEE